VAIVTVVVLAGGGIAAFVLTRPTPISAAVLEDRLLRQAPAATKAAGCDAVQTISPYPGKGSIDHAHVTQIPPLSTYPSTPPVSGPHAPIPPGPLPQGVYDHPPDIARAIHDLEHAAVDIWYSPSAPANLVTQIKDFFSRSDEDYKVLVMPYDYNEQGGTLPTGKLMALAAWHHLQLCAQPSLAVAFQFVRSYRLDPRHIRLYKGDAREPTAGI
jgi:hypothetical protein